ncbi:MAG: hypothetical protein AAGB51_08440 [Planctomycetota bacterium]
MRAVFHDRADMSWTDEHTVFEARDHALVDTLNVVRRDADTMTCAHKRRVSIRVFSEVRVAMTPIQELSSGASIHASVGAA